MLLIYPPGARAAEPPLGIARLAGYLREKGRPARCLDLGLEGILYLLGEAAEGTGSAGAAEKPGADEPAGRPGVAGPAGDPGAWTRGALRRRIRNLAALRDPATYLSFDRYTRAVLDLNRALKAVSAPYGAEAGLADYRELSRSPLRRSDLVAAAREPESSPFYPLFRRRLQAELSGSPGEEVGISVCFLSQALPAFAIAGLVRALAPKARIILGGGLVGSWLAQGSLEPRDRFEGFVDALVAGKGEEELGRLLGLGGDSTESGGVAEGGGAAESGGASAEGGTSWSLPDFSGFEDLRYLSPAKVIPYNFSSGCPWRRCSFCPEKAEGWPYAGIAAEAARRELASLAELHRPGLLHFTDNEISPLHLRALAESPPGAPWYGFARFTPLLADPGFCARLAAAGCRMLQLGLESGDQAVLDALGKGTRLEEIDRALEALAGAGVGVYLYVLFGTPAEDRDAALRTRDFVAARAERIDFLNVAVFNMPASSPEARAYPSRSFYEGELSLYSEFSHPRGWNRGEVRAFLAEDFEASPGIKSILRRNPPVFTSSHAPFFLRGGKE